MTIESITAVRGKIHALHAEHAGLQQQASSRTEVQSRVEATVRAWQEEARTQNALNLRLLASGHSPSLLDADAIGVMMVLLLGSDRVAGALLAGIESIPESVPAEQRQARLAAISRELDALEQEEEALIAAAEGEGHLVIRRADARPEIVLGRREPLPAVRPRSPHYQGGVNVKPTRRRVAVAPMFPGND